MTGQADLRRELELPEDERVDETRTDEAIQRALATLQRDHIILQRDYDEWVDRLERGGQSLVQKPTTIRAPAGCYRRRHRGSTKNRPKQPPLQQGYACKCPWVPGHAAVLQFHLTPASRVASHFCCKGKNLALSGGAGAEAQLTLSLGRQTPLHLPESLALSRPEPKARLPLGKLATTSAGKTWLRDL